MALDPNIALGVRGVEVANPLAQYAQVAQLQSLQNQNQVSQMQLDQMRRDEATLQQIQAKAVEHGGPADLNQIADAYLKSGNPKFVEFGIGLRQKLDERDQVAKIMSMGQPPAARPAPATNALAPTMQAGALGSGTFGMAPEPRVNQLAPAPAAPAPAANALATPGGLNLETLLAQRKAFIALKMPDMARALDAEIALASKEPVYHNVTGVGLVDPRNARVVVPSVEKPPAPPTSAAEYALAQKDPAFMEFLQKRAAATRPPAQPSAPVAVIDPNTGKQIFVSRDEALKNRMAPATALEGLTPKDMQKREAAFPQATLSVKSYESKTDSFIKELEALRDDPGLDQITGSVYGRTPSVSREGSRAQAAYNKIFAKGGFQALQDLRESSKTGGALGNVSNQEGERLERSIVGGLDRTQNAEDVKQGINDLINDIKTSKTRIRDAYDMTYEYRSQRGGATPAAGQGTGGFKYLGKVSN